METWFYLISLVIVLSRESWRISRRKRNEDVKKRKRLSRYGCIRSTFCWLLAKIMLRAVRRERKRNIGITSFIKSRIRTSWAKVIRDIRQVDDRFAFQSLTSGSVLKLGFREESLGFQSGYVVSFIWFWGRLSIFIRKGFCFSYLIKIPCIQLGEY